MKTKFALTSFVWVPIVPDAGAAGDPGFMYTLLALAFLVLIAGRILFHKS